MAALLIVDDDPIIRDTLCRLFADKYQCDTAAWAEQALEFGYTEETTSQRPAQGHQTQIRISRSEKTIDQPPSKFRNKVTESWAGSVDDDAERR